ncbi:MAG: BMP family protein [Parvibaculaceae bacterium]
MTGKFFVAAAAALLLYGQSAMAETLKVALLIPGLVTDGAVNQVAYEGMKRAEKDFGIEIAYTEKVSQATQIEVFSDYARRGYDIVVGVGGEYSDAAKRVAAQFPDTRIAVVNGAPSEGIISLNYDNQQFGYLAGLVGGRMTKTGKNAIVAGFTFEAFEQIVAGYKAGMKVGRPDGEVMVVFTNDWADVSKAKEASNNVIAQGADVLLPYLDAGLRGVAQATEEKGVHVVSVVTDMLKSHPKVTYVATSLDFGGALYMMVRMAKDGTLEKKDYRFGLGTEAGYLIGFGPEVPEAVRQEAEQAIKDMQSGKLDPDKL